MERVAILGLGLMGGSLGLALKEKGNTGWVCGYARSEGTRREALAKGVVDQVFSTPQEAVAQADFVVLCLPILSMSEIVRVCLPHFKPGSLLTDVGSTKASLAQELPPLLTQGQVVFIGSHPIAGSEQQGLEAARSDLYHRAVVVITPTEDSASLPLQRLEAFWTSLHSVVHIMKPELHDQILARTSHLPHLVATLLAFTVGREDLDHPIQAFCGSGFRDTTRIAEGSPLLWNDIFVSNKMSLLKELKAFKETLDRVIEATSGEDFEALKSLLEEGRVRRRNLLQRSVQSEEMDRS